MAALAVRAETPKRAVKMGVRMVTARSDIVLAKGKCLKIESYHYSVKSEIVFQILLCHHIF
jgi:hypothetical protein